jgi:hypothetical protein
MNRQNGGKIIKKALRDLQKNQDIMITTAPEYVIGYLCKLLSKSEMKHISTSGAK